VIDLRDHAEGANDVPIFFDETWRRAESTGNLFNEARVQHAQNSM
jgi:hypothetical protein